MLKNSTQPKPFVKWAGGKRQLLHELIKRLPGKITGYFEPFIGGGALFWALHQQVSAFAYQPCIGDFNEELINAYQVIKEKPLVLIEQLKHFINTEDFYYKVRAWDRCESYAQRSSVEKAARFIFLNKTGFNGLYRVNRSNQNNVPFGWYKNPTIVDKKNILACSKLLQHTDIYQGDFEAIASKVKAGNFVYLDPPYIPLTATSDFTAYTSDGFDLTMQQRLKEFCDYLTQKRVNFMLSNSSSPLVYKLYEHYHIDEVLAQRAINADGERRGKVVELIIKNYK